MSQFGKFAARYEQLQRSLRELAETKLANAVEQENAVVMKLREIRTRKSMLRTTVQTARTIWDLQDAWQQLRVLETVEATVLQEHAAASETVTKCRDEVHRFHVETERWQTVATDESKRDAEALQHVMSKSMDEWAMQSFGRTTR